MRVAALVLAVALLGAASCYEEAFDQGAMVEELVETSEGVERDSLERSIEGAKDESQVREAMKSAIEGGMRRKKADLVRKASAAADKVTEDGARARAKRAEDAKDQEQKDKIDQAKAERESAKRELVSTDTKKKMVIDTALAEEKAKIATANRIAAEEIAKTSAAQRIAAEEAVREAAALKIRRVGPSPRWLLSRLARTLSARRSRTSPRRALRPRTSPRRRTGLPGSSAKLKTRLPRPRLSHLTKWL